MTPLVLEKDIIIKRIDGIESEVHEMEKLGHQSLEQFTNGDGYKLAQYHLHRALEGVFNIGSHILSRLPGSQATEYREIARMLGEVGIVEKEFAEKSLIKMAKYRNRLVHFYAEITPSELYDILQQHLGDIHVYLKSIKNLLTHPEKYGLKVA